MTIFQQTNMAKRESKILRLRTKHDRIKQLIHQWHALKFWMFFSSYRFLSSSFYPPRHCDDDFFGDEDRSCPHLCVLCFFMTLEKTVPRSREVSNSLGFYVRILLFELRRLFMIVRTQWLIHIIICLINKLRKSNYSNCPCACN